MSARKKKCNLTLDVSKSTESCWREEMEWTKKVGQEFEGVRKSCERGTSWRIIMLFPRVSFSLVGWLGSSIRGVLPLWPLPRAFGRRAVASSYQLHGGNYFQQNHCITWFCFWNVTNVLRESLVLFDMLAQKQVMNIWRSLHMFLQAPYKCLYVSLTEHVQASLRQTSISEMMSLRVHRICAVKSERLSRKLLNRYQDPYRTVEFVVVVVVTRLGIDELRALRDSSKRWILMGWTAAVSQIVTISEDCEAFVGEKSCLALKQEAAASS